MPVLGWIKAREDQNEGPPLLLVTKDFDQISQDLGLPVEEVPVQVARLVNGGLITGERMAVMGQRSPVGFQKVGLTLEGLQAVGAWPGAPSQDWVLIMLESLAKRLPANSRERSGIEKLSEGVKTEGVKSLGRDTFIHVVGELAKMGAGQAMGLC